MKTMKRLPDSELEVMLLIWESGSAVTTGELLQKLSLRRKCNHQAVQSSLNRLADKGFIQCEKLGRLNYYTPLVDEAVYRRRETASFIEKMYRNSPGRLVATLLQQQALSSQDLDEIRQMLNQKPGKAEED